MVMQTLGIHFEGKTYGACFPNGSFGKGSILYFTPEDGMASIKLTPTPGSIKVQVVKEKDTSSPLVMDGSPLSIWLRRVPIYVPGSPTVAVRLKVRDAALQLFAMRAAGLDLDDAWTVLEAALRRTGKDVDAAVTAERRRE